MATTNTTMIEVLGQPAVRVAGDDGAELEVSLHGGHVLRWTAANREQQLYLSPRAAAGEGLAIRGGVPVIFPQFDQRGPDTQLPRHGFARTRRWALKEQGGEAQGAQVSLVLRDDEATRALWPHSFELVLTVVARGMSLALHLQARNTGQAPWAFTAALHTYLGVSNVERACLHGLAGARYWDNVARAYAVQDEPQTRIRGELDRIYLDAGDVRLQDGERGLQMCAHNLPDVVVWNPGAEKCAGLKDMPAEGWQGLLCVEAARVFTPQVLAEGESWMGGQTLTVLA